MGNGQCADRLIRRAAPGFGAQSDGCTSKRRHTQRCCLCDVGAGLKAKHNQSISQWVGFGESGRTGVRLSQGPDLNLPICWYGDGQSRAHVPMYLMSNTYSRHNALRILGQGTRGIFLAVVPWSQRSGEGLVVVWSCVTSLSKKGYPSFVGCAVSNYRAESARVGWFEPLQLMRGFWDHGLWVWWCSWARGRASGGKVVVRHGMSW